ncbi:cryptochrome-2 [Physcia stellaris]|nr:cryptochrome-2 [Physcia stellaris]
MYKLILVVFALFNAVASKRCTSITIPVDIHARNGIFSVSIPHNNFDVTRFVLNLTSASGNFTNTSLAGYATVVGTAHISAVFCAPKTMPKKPVVQFLTHGIGYDKTYWDLPYDNFKNSYVDAAVRDYRFCTLAIDRFGIGNSTVSDPLRVVQAPVTMATIQGITRMLRDGTVPSVPYRFDKVVHVGHSFGSALTYELVAADPAASDGIIMTGISFNGKWASAAVAGLNLELASLNQPARFGNASSGRTTEPNMENLPDGYVTWSNIQANKYIFFAPAGSDLAALEYSEAHKMPATIGEFLTLGSLPATAPEFKGPVLVITGNEDVIYCGGDCLAGATADLPSVPAGAKGSFPKAAAFEAYIQPNMGHAMNLHRNTTAFYHVMLDFLKQQKLDPR